jgi:polyisoprenoid-binding protein YceI
MKWILPVVLMVISLGANAQSKYFTRTAKVYFASKAPLENIEATNKTVSCVIDAATGAIEFGVLIKSFEFDKALMQEHFNENYMESDKFPKATFKGTITNIASVNFEKDGVYKVTVKGQMTVHGVTKDIEAPATITIKNGKINAAAAFNLLLSDYKIEIPAMVKDKISNTINLDISADLEKLNK